MGELLCMYCRTFGIYQSSLMFFVPQWKVWLQVVSGISLWLWFLRWQENLQSCYLFICLFVSSHHPCNFSCALRKKSVFLLWSFEKVFLHCYLILGFDFAPVTSCFCLKFQVLKIQKISSCFLPDVDPIVRYLQLLLTHQGVILWPKSPGPSHSLMVSKIFCNAS